MCMHTAWVMPWVPALCTDGAKSQSPETAGLLAPPHRLQIKVGGGPVAARKHLQKGYKPRTMLQCIEAVDFGDLRQEVAGCNVLRVFLQGGCRPSTGLGVETALNL